MNTIFRKVLAKKRLPKKDGVYIALRSGFLMGEWIWKDGEWQDDDNSGHKYELEWWLEEIELPTDEKINEMYPQRNSSGTYLDTNMGRREGAKDIRDFVLAVTA